MTGSQTPATGDGSPGGSDSGSPCDRIDERAPLQSPNPDVVERIDDEEILEIDLETRDERRIAVVKKDGEIAGSLAYRGVGRLIECIVEGHRYEALVLSKTGGSLLLRIRAE